MIFLGVKFFLYPNHFGKEEYVIRCRRILACQLIFVCFFRINIICSNLYKFSAVVISLIFHEFGIWKISPRQTFIINNEILHGISQEQQWVGGVV